MPKLDFSQQATPASTLDFSGGAEPVEKVSPLDMFGRQFVAGGGDVINFANTIRNAVDPAASITAALTGTPDPVNLQAQAFATRAQEFGNLAPNEVADGLAGTVAGGVGRVIPNMAAILGTGGGASLESLVPQALAKVPLFGRTLLALGRGAPTAAAMTTEQSANLSDNLTPLQQVEATGKNAAINLALAGLPVAVGSGPLVRTATGGALGAAIPAGTAALSGQPQDVANNIVGGLTGALLAQGGGRMRGEPLDPFLDAYARSAGETAPTPAAPLALPRGADFSAKAEPVRPLPVDLGGAVRVDPAGTAATPAQGANAFAQAVASRMQPTAPGLPEPMVTVDRAGNAATSADQNAAMQPAAPTPADPLGLTERLRQLIAADPRAAREGAPVGPLALPAPTIAVDAQGNAATTSQLQQAIARQQQAAAERQALGITPDIERSQGVRWSKQQQAAAVEAERQARLAELDQSIAEREAQNVMARGHNARPDETVDDALTFLAKKGGLDRRTFIKEGLDPAAAKAMENRIRGGASRPLFRAQDKGGMSLDHAAEALWQHGYLPDQDNNAALDMILAGVNQDTKAYSIHRQDQGDLLAMQQARNDAADHPADDFADVPFSRKPTSFDFSNPGGAGKDGQHAREVKVGDTTITYGVGRTGVVSVDHVATPPAKRGQGSARAAMQALVEQADREGLRVALTPEPMSKGVSKAGLEEFYRSLGFQPNKGRSIDFDTRHSMIRLPKNDAAFSFAGERAQTADRGALTQAKQMEAMGRDSVPDRFGNQPGSPEDTHIATGWHRGVDGKWRFEIDDSQARLDGARLLALDPEASANEVAIAHESMSKALRDGNRAEYQRQTERAHALQGAASRGDTVGALLHHPDLFAAYPELSKVKVQVLPNMKGLGAYSAGANVINIRAPTDYPTTGDGSLKSVLLHEIQHAIQGHEGFARGGNSTEARELPEFEDTLRQYMAKNEGRLPSWTYVEPGPEQMEQLAAREVYRRLAGEVEARNTQRRLPMDATQRRETPPSETADTPRSRQIVRFNADRAERSGPNAQDTQAIAKYNTVLSGYIGKPVRFTPAAHVPEPDARALAEADEVFGGRSIVVDNATPEALDLNGVTLRDGTRLINSDATSPAVHVAMHEMGHQMKADAPDLFAELEAEMDRQGALDKYQHVLSERAARNGEDPSRISDDLSREELVSDAIGDAMADPVFLEHLAQRNPGLFRRLGDYIMASLKALTRKLRDLGSREFLSDVEAFRTKLADVLDRYAERQQGGRGDRSSGDPKMSRKGPEYHGEHEAPMADSGSPLYDVTANGHYPEDVYSHQGLRYYGTGEQSMDAQAHALITRMRGRPNGTLEVYRAVPKGVSGKIARGDWVTPIRAYAVEHGQGALGGDYKIQKMTVRPRDLFTNGDSWLEWGYDPQPYDPESDAARREGRAYTSKKPVDPALSRKPAADQTETPEFKKWFGDSKVVDADGKPLVVYHGTSADFDQFKIPAFFTENRDGSEWYSTDRSAFPEEGGELAPGGRIVEAYLSIKKPLDATDNAGAMRFIDLAKRAGVKIEVTHHARGGWDFNTDEIAKHSPYDGDNINDLIYIPSVRRQLEAEGFDGVRANDVMGNDEIPVWLPLHPEQIKSATGNRGTFDADNPNILFSRKPNYTPEQREFMRKAGMSEAVDERTAIRRALDGLQGKRPHIDGDAFRQGAIDQFHGLKRAVDEKGGIAPENDPHLAAEMIQTASTMEAVLRFGAPELHKGALRVNRGVPGLLDALAPVHDTMPQWLGWMVAGRAKLLQTQGRENAMSAADIQAGLSLAKGHEAAFKQATAGYVKLKNAILDLAEQTGIIDPVARQAWDHAEYIPFYRDMDAGASGPGTRQGLANQSSGIRTLKGGEAPLKDPLGNIIANFTRLIDASMKNRAVALAVDQLGAPYFRKAALEMKAETIPLDQVKRHLLAQGVDAATIAGMPPSALRGVGRMLAVKAPEGDDIVRVMRAGKAEYYHVDDPLLLRSLTAFHEGPDHLAVKVLAWFKNLLTAGATGTPDFLIRNAIRDTGEASMTSRDRFLPLVDTARGAIDSFRETPLAQDLMMAGAAFHGGLFHTGNNEDTSKAIRRALRQHGLTDSAVTRYVKTLINPLRLWDIYRSIAESTEMGSRVSLARLRLKAGASDVEAAHEAKDFLNFQRRGDDKFVQAFTKVIPFLNARVQGADRLYRTGTTKGRRGKVLRRLAYLATLSTLLYWWNTEHYKDAYDELPDWDKDANWHIAPSTPEHLRIPKPFELGLVGGTLPERMYGALRYQLTGGEEGDRGKQSWDAFLRGIWNALGLNPVPQAVMPIAEEVANKNFYFGNTIEGMGDQYKAPSDRYGPTTSRTMRAASKGMAAVVGEDYTLSPKRLEHLWTGYTAGMGQYLLDGTDWVTQKATGAPDTPAWALRDYPFIGTVARGGGPPRTTRYVDEFYDLADQARMRSNQVKDAVHTKDAARAQRLEKEWGWLIGERQASGRAKEGFMNAGVREFNKTSAKLSAISKANAVIYADTTMSGQQKRDALDANLVKRNALVRTFVRQVRARQRQAGK